MPGRLATALPACLRTIDPRGLDPGRYLLWGMLVDAAEALVIGPVDPWRDDETVAREIRDWVLAEDPGWPFSFVNACAALALDPTGLRVELAPWLEIASRPFA